MANATTFLIRLRLSTQLKTYLSGYRSVRVKPTDMKKIILLLLVSGMYFHAQAQDSLNVSSEAADKIIGVWQTEDQKAQITIDRKDTVYQGKLSNATLSIDKTINLNLPTGLLGIYILRDLKFNGKNRWDGMIFDPKSKNTYDCYVKLEDDGTMKVRGYKGISLFGKSQHWNRMK
jgi:uncharacterized protein (DUF2147 family)